MEQGQIRIARVEADVLKRSGAELQTVQPSSPDHRTSATPGSTQVRKPVCPNSNGQTLPLRGVTDTNQPASVIYHVADVFLPRPTLSSNNLPQSFYMFLHVASRL